MPRRSHSEPDRILTLVQLVRPLSLPIFLTARWETEGDIVHIYDAHIFEIEDDGHETIGDDITNAFMEDLPENKIDELSTLLYNTMRTI